MMSDDDEGGRIRRSVSNSCGDIWIDGNTFLTLAAVGLGAIAFFLNQVIVSNGRKKRKKKRSSFRPQNRLLRKVALGTLYSLHFF